MRREFSILLPFLHCRHSYRQLQLLLQQRGPEKRKALGKYQYFYWNHISLPRQQQHGTGQCGLGDAPAAAQGGLSVTKRTAPSNMHDSDMQAKTTLRRQPQRVCLAPELLQEPCGCEAQLQPSCTPKTPRSAHSAAAPSAVNVSHFPCSSVQAGCGWGEKEWGGEGRE